MTANSLINSLIMLLILIYANISLAIDTITIDQGRTKLIQIAINNFNASNPGDNLVGNDITKVITNDLKHSGFFHCILDIAFIEKKIGVNHQPLFAAWRQINSEFLLNGQITKVSADKIKISFVLWDNILEKAMIAAELTTQVNLWRRAAHKIADQIYAKITGDLGYFATKIVYVSETGTVLNKQKRIAIMDYDGANHRYLTDGKSLVLTPRFSPQADKILYLSYIKKYPRVYMRDLQTGKDTLVGNFPGMTFAPRFSPDGTKALMSLAKNGTTHIYEIDLENMQTRKITSGYSINTSPTYSPDGTKIAFNSDRSGSRQLYVMNSDGSNIKRISFLKGKYTAPSWSPRGDYIAFTKLTQEGFTIGIMNPLGGQERIIASGFLVEGATWAPSGTVILFSKGEPPKGSSAGRNRIFSVNLTGYNEQEIPTPKDASDPEWSKVLN